MNRATRLAEVLVGAILLYSAIEKLANVDLFLFQVQRYEMISGLLLEISGLLILWSELIGGICLIAGKLRQGATLLAALLFLTFSLVTGVALIRGLTPDCGCFGAQSEPLTWTHWILISGTAAALLYRCYRFRRTRR